MTERTRPTTTTNPRIRMKTTITKMMATPFTRWKRGKGNHRKLMINGNVNAPRAIWEPFARYPCAMIIHANTVPHVWHFQEVDIYVYVHLASMDTIVNIVSLLHYGIVRQKLCVLLKYVKRTTQQRIETTPKQFHAFRVHTFSVRFLNEIYFSSFCVYLLSNENVA